MTEQQVYMVGIPIVVAMIAIELAVSLWRNRGVYEWYDTWGSLGMLAGNMVMGAAVKGLTLTSFFLVYEYRFWTLKEVLPTWALWLTAFVTIDLAFYVWHRCSHRLSFLWAIHMNHHCSEHLNFVVAFRQPWLAPLFKIPFFAVLALLGQDPTMLAVAGVILTLWGVVGHTQLIPKLGSLEWIFNTPSHHRVHHGSNPQYIDKNYGNWLIIWDRMFGTFEAEHEPVVYGLTHQVGTNNPWRLTWYEWHRMVAALRQARSLGDAMRIVFGPPDTAAPSAQAPPTVVPMPLVQDFNVVKG